LQKEFIRSLSGGRVMQISLMQIIIRTKWTFANKILRQDNRIKLFSEKSLKFHQRSYFFGFDYRRI